MEDCGGTRVARVLKRHGVRFLFTLCGGHISPILVAARREGIQVVDVRDEASAVFAADAVARMSGVTGVAAVTAGPGVTNAVTALKNAQMAESPVLVLGGATATMLRGRGSLQDIDQLPVVEPVTKWSRAVGVVAGIEPTLERALETARSGIPGPVFVQIPVDLLYPEATVREWYLREGSSGGGTLSARLLDGYLRCHLYRLFHGPSLPGPSSLGRVCASLHLPVHRPGKLQSLADILGASERPALVVGSQAMMLTDAEGVAAAVRTLGIPTWLAGMARGLLGRASEIQFRHERSRALKEADLVILAGVPCDFRLGYGRSISRRATLVGVNLDGADLVRNRRPDVAIQMHPGELLRRLAGITGDPPPGRWDAWFGTLRERERARDRQIDEQARTTGEWLNPIHLLKRVEEAMDPESVLIVDGGDFAATAAYVLRPRGPLSWLDPGVFGTLGVGGGFALGAALTRPGHEVWLVYGDGSCAYSLAEFDTFRRHGLAPIALVGTDASWSQIAREQVPILGDAVGTVLDRIPYHRVAEGYGGIGLLLDDPGRIDAVLAEAKTIARSGRPVLINAQISPTDFRKGSISI